MAETTITREMIEAAAAAIANARADRGRPDGGPGLRLEALPQPLRDELMEDAEAAVKAALVIALDADCMWDDTTRIAINGDAEARIAALEASLPFAISRHLSTICSHLLGLYDASADPKVRELAVAIRVNTADAGEAFASALGAQVEPTDALAKLTEIPPPGSEERGFWLEAARDHGFSAPREGGSEGNPPWYAWPNAILTLMSEARKQGQRDVLAASARPDIDHLSRVCARAIAAANITNCFPDEARPVVKAVLAALAEGSAA